MWQARNKQIPMVIQALMLEFKSLLHEKGRAQKEVGHYRRSFVTMLLSHCHQPNYLCVAVVNCNLNFTCAIQ